MSWSRLVGCPCLFFPCGFNEAACGPFLCSLHLQIQWSFGPDSDHRSGLWRLKLLCTVRCLSAIPFTCDSARGPSGESSCSPEALLLSESGCCCLNLCDCTHPTVVLTDGAVIGKGSVAACRTLLRAALRVLSLRTNHPWFNVLHKKKL